MAEFLTPLVDRMQAFEERAVSQEYKLGDLFKLFDLINTFTDTFQEEASLAKESIEQLKSSVEKTKMAQSCTEQKVHYLERQITTLQS